MTKVVSIVGMAGSGKSEAARIFIENSFHKIRFGDITDREVKKRGLELNERNENLVRLDLRRQYGMAAYARLSLPEIEAALESRDVVVDGLYSWEEYTLLKERYGDRFYVVAVWASPRTRYARLAQRAVRPLTREEAVSRDASEIENSHKGGPIAMADYTILNERSIEDLNRQTERVLEALKCHL